MVRILVPYSNINYYFEYFANDFSILKVVIENSVFCIR